MTHIIFGGDGFVGRYLARDLLAMGHEVIVADAKKSPLPTYDMGVRHVSCDVIQREQLDRITPKPGDVVYNLAAHLLLPIKPRRERDGHFHGVIVEGTRNILDWMRQHELKQLVQFSTDMVYGVPEHTPVPPDAPRAAPMGPYAATKQECEDLCLAERANGLNVTIFRPRMIIGPGRFGLLSSLFKLIDANLPVPLIGRGKNHYQMVSVFDCADAARLAGLMGCPNGEHNLGSENPPKVEDLLNDLIKAAGSRSFLLRMPAPLMKTTLDLCDRVGIHLLVPEQFHVADLDYIVDIESTKRTFNWRPQYDDKAMIKAAYQEYRRRKSGEPPVEMVMDTANAQAA